MAKTIQFDRTDVIDKAKDLYWEKGFHATSMRNLQDAVDMRPGSIYAAFGSKEGLFKEAITHYAEAGLGTLKSFEQQTASPVGALKLFIKDAVIGSNKSGPNNMCMLTKTLAELTAEHQDLIDFTKGHLKQIENAFEALIKKGQDLGEVAKSKDASYLSGYLQMQIAGLRTYAKINDDLNRLELMIDEMFEHYPFK